MARMHSRKKGKSASKKPTKKAVPAWVGRKPKEVEMLVVKLAKDKKTQSQIGMVLRDVYGVPDVKTITKRSISQILKEHKQAAEIPDDMMALIRKSIELRKHLEENHKDQPAKRGLILTDSKIKRLAKYYKRTKRISADWKYDPDKIRLQIG